MTTGTLAMPRRHVPRPAPVAPPLISNTRIAIIIIIAAEAMFFVGLIGTFLVFRLAAPVWPPPNLPRLPLLVTTFNSVLLFASMVPMTRALRAIRADRADAAARALSITALLGVVFLLVQGGEWVRLVRHGLTLGSSMYGATFYMLIGCHALHVLCAVAWLATVAALAHRGTFSAPAHAGLEMCAIYWYFVCGLWIVLFPLVYLY